ncbi:MAG: apolipoprotein N-acyltransferase [Gammaproteobacteria bacterium]|nr:apolipoprotein N-acyltransferase [Gammaproteobacteria bacterium]
MGHFAASLSAARANLLALVAGAALPLAFAPVSFFPLAILAPAVLFLLWRDASPREAFWRGLYFGWGQFGVGVSWVYVAIHDFGHAPVPLAVLLTALFVSVLAFFPALAGALAARLPRVPDAWRLGLLFPAVWVLVEWLRGWILTGFPWLNLGYSQIESPLRGFAPVAGVYGLSLVVAVSAGLVLLLVVAARRVRLAALAVLLSLWITGGVLAQVEWTEASGPPIRVALIQGNIPQDTKWRPELVQRTLDLYADLTRQHWDRQLILWPEAAITVFYDEVAGSYLAGIEREARTHGTDLVIGIPYMDRGTRRYYNSLLSLGSASAFYHKRHLVPFGDYLPLQDYLRGLIRFFDLPMSGFSHGPAAQPLLTAAGQKIASAVCYEDIFGEELIAALPEAGLIVNATNNAWYGNSFAPHQHLEMSRLRALETGRTLLRVTTNGVSAIVGPDGRIMARSPQFETAVLTGEAVPYRGATPYVRFGNYPAIGLALAGLVMILVLERRRRARRGARVE